MSMRRFLKLEGALELLNSLDKDRSDFEIAVLSPDASTLTDKGEGDDNEVNTGEIIANDIPGTVKVRVGVGHNCELWCFDNKSQTKS
ncbi:hypothetical protein HNY73_002396 [Argiope bruennichi]|uniref:Uncharacterized protein n=1 Tax=Argiope bruennichi TaxID=94029 RepID=A0A8T0FZU7_ARGBR|nr:hypothetical protein HNY73_002396 [Argiope bruennichi]